MHRALIVDDSPVMRAHMRTLLAKAGCQVVGEAANGDEAVALYEQLRPDLMTLDIVMPGKDGVAVASEVMSRHPGATIVMCTSMTSRDKILACQRAGVKHYLLKPVQEDRALAVLQAVLGKVRATPPPIPAAALRGVP